MNCPSRWSSTEWIYEDIADSLEAFAQENSGKFQEVSSSGLITLTFQDRRLSIVFDSEHKKPSLLCYGRERPIAVKQNS